MMEISQEEAETHARLLAKEEGIFAGISSGGAVSAALRLCEREENAVIVCIICDRGDRYLSTGKSISLSSWCQEQLACAEFNFAEYFVPLVIA